jgi:hypothetical protein
VGRHWNIQRPTGVTTKEVHAALELDDPPQVHAGKLIPRAWLHAVDKAYGIALLETRPPHTPTPAAPAPRPARVSSANKLPDIDSRLSISFSKVSTLSVQPVVQHDLSTDCAAPWPPAASAQPCVGDSAAQKGARSCSAAAVCV